MTLLNSLLGGITSGNGGGEAPTYQLIGENPPGPGGFGTITQTEDQLFQWLNPLVPTGIMSLSSPPYPASSPADGGVLMASGFFISSSVKYNLSAIVRTSATTLSLLGSVQDGSGSSGFWRAEGITSGSSGTVDATIIVPVFS